MLLFGSMRSANLSACFLRITCLFNMPWSELDRDAVRFGVMDSNLETNVWFEYPTSNMLFKLAYSLDQSSIHLQIKLPAELRDKMQATLRILQYYQPEQECFGLAPLIEEVFDNPLPKWETGVDFRELQEYQGETEEALRFYSGRHWKELIQHCELPCNFAGLYFIPDEARLFFFPAYLHCALKHKDVDVLYTAHSCTNHRATPFTVSQRILTDFARDIIEEHREEIRPLQFHVHKNMWGFEWDKKQ